MLTCPGAQMDNNISWLFFMAGAVKYLLYLRYVIPLI